MADGSAQCTLLCISKRIPARCNALTMHFSTSYWYTQRSTYSRYTGQSHETQCTSSMGKCLYFSVISVGRCFFSFSSFFPLFNSEAKHQNRAVATVCLLKGKNAPNERSEYRVVIRWLQLHVSAFNFEFQCASFCFVFSLIVVCALLLCVRCVSCECVCVVHSALRANII